MKKQFKMVSKMLVTKIKLLMTLEKVLKKLDNFSYRNNNKMKVKDKKKKKKKKANSRILTLIIKVKKLRNKVPTEI